ncbi:MAG: helix-turn-helix domain-containing protein [Lachnospiraceae bacterium]
MNRAVKIRIYPDKEQSVQIEKQSAAAALSITRCLRTRSAITRRKKRCSGTHRPDIRRNIPG